MSGTTPMTGTDEQRLGMYEVPLSDEGVDEHKVEEMIRYRHHMRRYVSLSYAEWTEVMKNTICDIYTKMRYLAMKDIYRIEASLVKILIPTSTINDELKALIKAKRRAEKIANQTRLSEDRKSANRLRVQVRDELRLYRAELLKTYFKE